MTTDLNATDVVLPMDDVRKLLDLAILGFNAEIRFKSARRFKGERDSEFALRKAQERALIVGVRSVVALPETLDPPTEIL